MFTPAFAQTSGVFSNSSDIIQFMVPMVAILGIMYFMLLRPQQKKQKDFQAMIAAVRRNDTIVTTGGLIGKVTKATDGAELEVEIAPNVRVRVARSGISEIRAKGEPVKEAPVKA